MLSCFAKTVENVNNDSENSDFWLLLGNENQNSPLLFNDIPRELLMICEPFEKFIAKLNVVYRVFDDLTILTAMSSNIPNRKLFADSNAVSELFFCSVIKLLIV